MTKQHFIWAAEYIRRERRSSQYLGDPKAADQMEAFAVALFRHFGPSFDESRFRTACREQPYRVKED